MQLFFFLLIIKFSHYNSPNNKMSSNRIIMPLIESRPSQKYQNYVIKMLEHIHIQQAVQLLAEEFQSQEPLTNSYYRSFPLQSCKKLEKWQQFWRMFSNDFGSNMISVGCFDAENDMKLVGVSVAKDLHFSPESFDCLFMNEINFISTIIHIEEALLKKVDQNYQSIFSQEASVLDIWGVAIKKQHMGKGLLHRMMRLNEQLGRMAGFRYSFSFATNFKTGISLTKLQYDRIACIDSAQFEDDGIRPFQTIEDLQRYPSIWFKSLKTLKNDQLSIQ